MTPEIGVTTTSRLQNSEKSKDGETLQTNLSFIESISDSLSQPGMDVLACEPSPLVKGVAITISSSSIKVTVEAPITEDPIAP